MRSTWNLGDLLRALMSADMPRGAAYYAWTEHTADHLRACLALPLSESERAAVLGKINEAA